MFAEKMAAECKISLAFGSYSSIGNYTWNSNNNINQVSNVNTANSMQILKGSLLRVDYTGLNHMKLA